MRYSPGAHPPGTLQLPDATLLLLLLLPLDRVAAMHDSRLLRRHARDSHADLRRFTGRGAVEQPAMGCDVAVVPPHRQPDVLRSGVVPLRRVKSDPSPVRP